MERAARRILQHCVFSKDSIIRIIALTDLIILFGTIGFFGPAESALKKT